MSAPTFSSMVSFTTGATGFAADWNSNYAYIVTVLSDGNRDLTIRSLTASGVSCTSIAPSIISGSPTINSNVVFGDAITDTTTASGAVIGASEMLNFGHENVVTLAGFRNAIFYGVHRAETPPVIGYKMHRAGSVRGISVWGICTTFDLNHGYQFSLWKNLTTTMITSPTFTFTASGATQSWVTTPTRGVLSFAAGDTLTPYLTNLFDGGAAGGIETVQGHLEVVYNT